MSTAEPEPPVERALTLKSILSALITVVIIMCTAAFAVDELRVGNMIGNHLPVAIYTMLFLLVALWNPFLGRFVPPLRFNQKETAVYFILVLVGCWCATSGLYRYFNRTVIAPVYLERANPTWTELDLVDQIPKKLFPLEGQLEAPAPSDATAAIPASGENVYSGFVQGLNIQSEGMFGAFGEMSSVLVAWSGPMQYWGALFAALFLCILSLSLLFHRQWSRHEQLAYPLAQIASQLVQRDSESRFTKLLRSRLFWAAFIFVFSYHSIRYLHLWFPLEVPDLPTKWDMPWKNIFPILKESGFDDIRFGSLIFACVGVAYFTSTQISFSVGFGPIFVALLGAQFYTSSGKPLSREDLNIGQLGAYVAYGLMLLWAGRVYYGRSMAGAVGLLKTEEKDRDGVWAARSFLIFFIATIWILTLMEFDWLVATIFTLSFLLVFTIMSRVVCETGIPFMQSFPGGGIFKAFSNLFGPAFFGAKPILMFNWLNVALAADPRECLMPYVSTAFRVSDDFKLKMRRMAIWMGVFILVGLAVGFLARSYSHYKFGAQNDGYAWGHAAKASIQNSVPYIQFLEQTGQRVSTDAASGFGKLAHLDFNGTSFSYFSVGLGLTLLIFFLRFRFTAFPFHPALLIVAGTYANRNLWTSFLIGWAIKLLVVKFGGGRIYQDLKPLFIGLILAELVVAGLAILVGFIYYGITGLNPIGFSIFPG